MRLLKFPGTARILLLILLIAAALPVVGSRGGMPGMEKVTIAATEMDMRACEVHRATGAVGVVCAGMMLHCATCLSADVPLPDPAEWLTSLRLRPAEIRAESVFHETSPPPPRA